MELIRTRRDLRVDFARGLALWWIFTDHIPTDWLNRVSLRDFALCDAAEVFVLLAGYAAGLAYGRAMLQQGWVFAAADVARRAWVLYVAHIFLFVVFSAQVAYSATLLNRADFLDEIHIDVLGESPYRALLEALTLRFQPSFLNILPLYVVLLLLLIPALPLLRRPRWLLGLSAAIYVVGRFGGVTLPSWGGGGWYFNPLTWQLLFMLGAVLAFHPLRRPRRVWPADLASAVVVVLGGILQWLTLWRPELVSELPRHLARLLLSIDKEGLHPLRLLSIIALTWLAVRLVPKDAAWLGSRWTAPFLLAGQHSLPVFCCGIFLSFLGRLGMEIDSGWTGQVAVNVLGAGALLGVALLSAWYGAKGRPRVPQLPAPEAAP